MRLTLRTLLAYLDDTMDPAEIKQFGQRVAESETAQELISRIRQITRKRRILTPPLTGPGAMDSDKVAKYLDNELELEQVAELEKLCLESDVHLAEVAACHQILSLNQGQPALVPPTAYERMYSLVQGKESIPHRKSGSGSGKGIVLEEETEGSEPEQSLVAPVSPTHPPASWLKWAIPTAAALLLVGAGFAIMMALPPAKQRKSDRLAEVSPPRDPIKPVETRPIQNNDKPKSTPEKNIPDQSDLPAEPPTDKPSTSLPPPKPTGKPLDNPAPVEPTPVPKDPPVVAGKKPTGPSLEQVQVGFYQNPSKLPEGLVQQTRDGWKHVVVDKPVVSNQPLMSLPGFKSEIAIDPQLRVLLWGLIPEFSLDDIMARMMESAVILHPSREFDLDMTLLRGRFSINSGNRSPDKPPTRVRLRFEKEIWDITLKDPNTEVGIDLVRHWPPNGDWITGQPRTDAFLFVLKGSAELRIDSFKVFNLVSPPGKSLFAWNNEGPGDNRGNHSEGVQETKMIPNGWNKAGLVEIFKMELKELDNLIPKLTPEQAREPAMKKQFLESLIKPAMEMEKSLKVFGENLSSLDKPLGVILMETCQPSHPTGERLLSIYSMGALDDVGRLFDVLFSENIDGALDRLSAITVLRNWIARNPDQSKKLYSEEDKTKNVFVSGNRFTLREAKAVNNLLHDVTLEQAKSPKTYETLAEYLASEKLPLRELANWQFRNLLPGGGGQEPFNPIAPEEMRRSWIKQFKQKIADGLIPGMPKNPGEMPEKIEGLQIISKGTEKPGFLIPFPVPFGQTELQVAIAIHQHLAQLVEGGGLNLAYPLFRKTHLPTHLGQCS